MPLKIIRHDITKIKCDVVVNPTDRFLSGSGGVDAAIHRTAGKGMVEHCRGIGSLSVGEAVITPAYDMPRCKYVIHVAGPEWQGGLDGERVLLKSCYLEALKLAVSNDCESIAFPLIASGTYGYPKEKVLKVAIEVISDFLNDHELDVYVLVYDKTAYRISQHLQADIESYIDNFYVEMNSSIGSYFREEKNYEKYQSESIPDGYFETAKRKMAVGGVKRAPKPKATMDASILCDAIDLPDMLKDMDKGFSDTLFDYIDKKELTDVEAYKRANVSRKVFSKIKCDANYKPIKITAVSFAIGLHLDMEETKHLLSTAGICLSRANKFDVIIEYFIITGAYKSIHDVNEVLYQYDQVLLGC